jgi:hypothetical protein
MVDLLTILTIENSIVETVILVLLMKWFAFDRKQAKKRPRKRKEPTVVVQTVIPKETE